MAYYMRLRALAMIEARAAKLDGNLVLVVKYIDRARTYNRLARQIEEHFNRLAKNPPRHRQEVA